MKPTRPPLRHSSSVLQFVKDLNEDEASVVRELFSLADKDKNGYLTRDELWNVMIEMGVKANEEEFQLLFEGMDIDSDGKISLREFMTGVTWLRKTISMGKPAAPPPQLTAAEPTPSKPALVKRKSLADFSRAFSTEQQQSVRELFSMVDANHDGQISLAELARVLLECGVTATAEETRDLFMQLDENKDGKITLDEFLHGMKHLNKAFQMSGKLTRFYQPSVAEVQQQLAEATEQKDILLRYLRENFVERSLKKAQELFDAKEYHACKALLELLDMTRLEKLHEYSGGLLTVESQKHFEQLKQKLFTVLQGGKK